VSTIETLSNYTVYDKIATTATTRNIQATLKHFSNDLEIIQNIPQTIYRSNSYNILATV